MSVTRIFDLLPRYSEKFDKSDALASKESGVWKTYSTKDFVENSLHVSLGLLSLGIQREEKIAIISNNRPEWNFVDMGIQQAGAVSVPIYPTISENDLKFILLDAEVKYIFVSSEELYKKVKSVLPLIPSLKEVYTFNKIEQVRHWSEIVELGKKSVDLQKLQEIKASIRDTDLVTILYTSGTTGNPKGVMLSHKNLVSNFYAARNLAPVDHTSRALSFLPLNHVYERMLTYLWMYLGVSIYYAESLDTIGDNLKELKPHAFSTVPRLLEKVYDKIVAKGAELTGIKKTLFFWALNLGLRYELKGANGWWYETQLKMANKLIFNKWREALGGNIKVIVSGGAALQPRLARIFWAAKIHVLEGYGLTETSPVVCVNNLEANGAKFTTVGPLLEDVEVKIAADGEILVKGPNVMMGYYKHPELTAEVIDSEGFFHTGDIGILDEGRFLKITDRKKEIFKTSGGKYIAPQIIENKLKESPFIEQALVIGENQKYAAALIVPAFVYIKDWCFKNGIPYTGNHEMILNNTIIAKIQEAVDSMNSGLAPYETIKKFELMSTEWSIENGEMTPKLSLKRKIILEANRKLVEKIFNS